MKTHPIPSSFRLRRSKWTVVRATRGRIHHAGVIAPTPRRITLYEMAHNRRRTESEVQKTFWHEITHAVLFTMKNKLARNEKFVTQFGLLLEEMIRTARFPEEEPM